MEDQQKTFDVRVSMEVKLTQQDVDDIICTALEGGITYWADKAVVVGEYLGEYASEQISRGGKLRIRTMEPFDKNNTRWYELNTWMEVNRYIKFLTGCEKIFNLRIIQEFRSIHTVTDQAADKS